MLEMQWKNNIKFLFDWTPSTSVFSQICSFKKKYLNIILLFTLLGFIPDIINNLSEYLFNISIPIENELVNKMSHLKIIILTVFIAPIIETILFQTFFFRGALNFKFFRDYKLFIILISSISFSLVHYYSIEYVFFALYGGFILALCYSVVLKKSNSHKTATIATTIIHSLRNFIIFLIVNVFHLL